MEQFHFVKEYHNQTTIHPVGVVALVVAFAAVFLVSRRHALIPLIVIACIIASAQRVVVLGLDFTFLRLLTGVAWIRVLAYSEHRGFQLNRLDRLLVAWVGASMFASVLLHPTAASITYQLGVAFDAITTYFLVRVFVRNRADLVGLAHGAAFLSIPVAVAMAYERFTGQNIFSVFGGVPEHTLERFGRYRAQAAFAHPIVAGVFWASLIPVILSSVRRDLGSVLIATTGVIGSMVIIWCCASSTPVLLVGVILACSLLYPVRWAVPWLRGSIASLLVVLHIAMFPPVWHLFARINFFPGSTGWWRYLIIDKFVNNWEEWLLIGTTNSAQWLHGGAFVDVTNQYVNEGINGGIVKLGLFIAMLVLSFRFVGRAMRRVERLQVVDRRSSQTELSWMAWCIGVLMTVHAAAYFATAYFGQLVLMQYLSLGIAASLLSIVPASRTCQVEVPQRSEGPQLAGAPSKPAAGAGGAGGTGAAGPRRVPGLGWRPAGAGSTLFRPV